MTAIRGCNADGGTVTAIDDLLARNLAAAEYHPVGMGPMPTLQIALLMCMDARIDGHAAFRLSPGEVHLLRNAGGVVTDDVIRSLSISQHALGTREIMIIHHTDCGLARLEEDVFRAHLATFAGYRPTWSVQAFKDPHDSVRESLRRIRDSPFLLHHDAVRGFIFDVNTGLLEEVFTDGEEPTRHLTAAGTAQPPGSGDAGAAATVASDGDRH
ncbi:beta-class carbonic anhydrase [Nakamurella sp. GG22]